MDKAEKIIQKWKANRPVTVPVDDVRIVLEKFFPGKWKWDGGSHIVVTESILKAHPKFNLGIITIPTVSGRSVKQFYIKNILQAIDLLKQFEEWNNGKKS